MASNRITTNLQALIDLQANISNLSKELHSIYELMHENMNALQEYWKDAKYQEFIEGYAPQIRKCDTIANRYDEWCKKALQQAIEKTESIDQVKVTL